MNQLKEFAQYLLDTDQRKVSSLINELNSRKRLNWRLTDSQCFNYDLIEKEYPFTITSLKQLENYQLAIFQLEQMGIEFNCYLVDKEKGVIPFGNVEQAIEKTMGMDQFLKTYLEPYFKNQEEWLEDFEEAYLYLSDCLE